MSVESRVKLHVDASKETKNEAAPVTSPEHAGLEQLLNVERNKASVLIRQLGKGVWVNMSVDAVSNYRMLFHYVPHSTTIFR